MTGRPAASAPIVFACGQSFRGDDGVAFEIVAALDDATRSAATIVEGGALDVAQLVALPADARCIVVDAVAGIEPGALIELDLEALATAQSDAAAFRSATRSTHALPIPQTLSLARQLRGRSIQGTLIGVGIAQCVPGTALSHHVAAAVPAAARSLANLIRPAAGPESHPC